MPMWRASAEARSHFPAETKVVKRSAQQLFACAQLARREPHDVRCLRTSAVQPIVLLGDPCLGDVQKDPVDLAVALRVSSPSAVWSARPEEISPTAMSGGSHLLFGAIL